MSRVSPRLACAAMKRSSVTRVSLAESAWLVLLRSGTALLYGVYDLRAEEHPGTDVPGDPPLAGDQLREIAGVPRDVTRPKEEPAFCAVDGLHDHLLVEPVALHHVVGILHPGPVLAPQQPVALGFGVELGSGVRHSRVEVGKIRVELDRVARGPFERRGRLAGIAEDEEAERLDPRGAHVLQRLADLEALEALHHVLAGLVRFGFDPEREHPAARSLQPIHEGGVLQVVGARIAEPPDVQSSGDELLADRAERFHIERDRVAPQIEELPAVLAYDALHFVDQRRGAPLAELVALMERRDAEVARIRTSARGFADEVR